MRRKRTISISSFCCIWWRVITGVAGRLRQWYQMQSQWRSDTRVGGQLATTGWNEWVQVCAKGFGDSLADMVGMGCLTLRRCCGWQTNGRAKQNRRTERLRMCEIELTGLDGSNLLAYLAALGTLRVLTLAEP